MLVLVVLSMAILLSYTFGVVAKIKKIPRSVSATFYAIEHKRWFKFCMTLPSLLTIPPILEHSCSWTGILAFAAMIGMYMVGLSPDYINDNHQKKMHYAGASLLVAGTQLWILFNCPTALLFWVPYVLYVFIFAIKNKAFKNIKILLNSNPMFWAEMVLINTFVVLILKIMG